MRTTTTTRWGSLLAATTLTFGLAACGSEGEVVEPAAPEPAASTATGADGAGSEGTGATTQAADALAEGEEIPVTQLLERLKSPGEEMLSSFEVTLDLAVEGESMALQGAVDLGGETPEMDVDAEVPGMGALSMILVDGDVYISVPGLTQEGRYAKVPAAQLESFGAGDLTSSMDLDATWEGWETGATSVTYVGSEDVDGEPMDHFEVVVDTAAAAEALGESATDGMPGELTYELWVDGSDLMRQMAFDVEGQGLEMSLDGWGEDVEVTAPDPSQVMELPGMTG